MLQITSANFEAEVLKSDIPVLVDFWAPWCGPCKMLGPILEEMAQELDGKVKIGKINVDEENALAVQFSVMSIPTIILFKNGEVFAKSVGFKDKASLLAMAQG